MKKKVLMAMSGGVDSSVSALLLKEEGFEVIGATMCFSAVGGLALGGNISGLQMKHPSCCGIEGIEDARRVAQQLDIPHYVLNYAKHLERAVISDFVNEYIQGRTPNPCVRCNQYLKFSYLFDKAKSLGIDYVATGHFARIQRRGRYFFLKKGIDSKKDQSYFLYRIKREKLANVLFPLGAMTKEKVREIAKKKGLAVALKPGSQEVCFVTDGDYRSFLRGRLGKEYFRQGEIVDLQGKVLGHHDGFFQFTIGQRSGLGIAAAHPLYCLELQPKNNRVVVGKRADAYALGLIGIEPNILAESVFRNAVGIKAKIRYNHPEVDCHLSVLSKNRYQVKFETPQFAVTPGQSAVFYHNDLVAGGIKIVQSLKREEVVSGRSKNISLD